MTIKFPKILLTLFVLNIISLPGSQTINLWEGDAPGAMGTATIDIPTLKISTPPDSTNNGAGILMIPGGGYKALSNTSTFERWLTEAGFTVFSLKYRLPIYDGYKWPIPFWDASRGMRTVRHLAGDYNLDTNRIGVAGFSSGGHLSSTLATHYDLGNPDTLDVIEQKKSRPDFMLLMSPVITFIGPYTHTPSLNRMLGTDPPPDLQMVEYLSNQLQVTINTPPTFMAHGDQDGLVSMENSILFDSALQANGVASKFVIAPGFAHNVPHDGEWTLEALAWLDSLGYLDPIIPVNKVNKNNKKYIVKYLSNDGVLKIEFLSGFSELNQYELTLFNLKGEYVYGTKLKTNRSNIILLNDFENSVYSIKISGDNFSNTFKILIY